MDFKTRTFCDRGKEGATEFAAAFFTGKLHWSFKPINEKIWIVRIKTKFFTYFFTVINVDASMDEMENEVK